MKTFTDFISEASKIKQKTHPNGDIEFTKDGMVFNLSDRRNYADGKVADPYVVSWDIDKGGWVKRHSEIFRLKGQAINFIKNYKEENNE